MSSSKKREKRAPSAHKIKHPNRSRTETREIRGIAPLQTKELDLDISFWPFERFAERVIVTGQCNILPGKLILVQTKDLEPTGVVAKVEVHGVVHATVTHLFKSEAAGGSELFAMLEKNWDPRYRFTGAPARVGGSGLFAMFDDHWRPRYTASRVTLAFLRRM